VPDANAPKPMVQVNPGDQAKAAVSGVQAMVPAPAAQGK
jgi:hypothetical protein